MGVTAENSVSIDSEAKLATKRASGASGLTWRRALILIIVFLFVVSDYFINNVVSLVPKATSGREVTNTGAFVQGVCLVIVYALVLRLAEMQII